ncbi:MAG: hypothetical protein ABI183_18885 [Polyangiaceae bacterium]
MRGASFLRVPVRAWMMVGLGLLAAGAPPLACSGANSGSGFNGDGGTGALGDGSSGGALGNGEGGGGTIGSDGCSDAAKLVYVVDSTNGLHSFDPSTLKFSTIGKLKCPTSGGALSDPTPNSMGVDRSGTAWVNFDDGELFKVSTANAACTATTYSPSNNQNEQRWGMAFSSNAVGSTAETLFAVPNNGQSKGSGVNSLDLTSLKLSTIGPFTDGLAGKAAELTGTGNGDLYAFVTTSPYATLAKIDKTSGATLLADQVPLDGVNTGMAFAFSFWGGDFWFYTSPDGVASSVTQYKASGDKSIDVVVGNTGFAIVGAGVSTCAPTAPPR